MNVFFNGGIRPARRLKNAVFTILWILPFLSNAQAPSFFEAGVVSPKFHSAGHWTAQPMPGFTVAISGLTISYYAGQAKSINELSPKKSNASFLNVGYLYRFKPLFGYKRLHATLGSGFGKYGVNGNNGFQLNLEPGLQVDISRGVSLAAGVYAGYNFYGAGGRDTNSFGGYKSSGYLSTEKWFLMPKISLRFHTSPSSVKGESYSRSSYWGGGYVTDEIDHGTYTEYSHYYLPAGDYISDAIITSTNYVNFYPKMLVGTTKDNRGATLAGGGGLAFRLGLFNFDLEWLHGRIGYLYGPYSDYNYHHYWNMDRKSASIGFNFFNIAFPFKGPSIVRLIIGQRLGVQSLQSVLDPNMPLGTGIEKQDIHNKFFHSPFLSLEFGTLGINFDYFTAGQDKIYRSTFVVGASYLIPLTK